MTKKRFVKLMMAIGYSRNRANKIAASVAVAGKSYRRTWVYYYFKPKLPPLPEFARSKYPYAVI